MGEPSASAGPKPCCVCDEPGGKHCTKCKSRHYCSKACQLVDWNERGHKAQCKRLATDFHDQLLDELMPEKLKIKEEPPIVDDVAPASVVRAEKAAAVKANAPNNGTPSWRGTCAICLDGLPVGANSKRFYECCCKMMCAACSDKCDEYDDRCPFCRAPICNSNAEWLRRVQKHVDKGDAHAQAQLGSAYDAGAKGLKQSFKRAFHLYELAAAQGYALAQHDLGVSYDLGHGVKSDQKTAAQWYRRAAEQGYPFAQYNLGAAFDRGQGVAQSDEEAVKWYRLAAAQGEAHALFNLGACHSNGQGVPQDLDEALRLFKRAAAEGLPIAAAQVEVLEATLAATRSG